MCALSREFVVLLQARTSGRPDCGAPDAKKLDMRAIMRTTAVILVTFSLGWAGCQSTHSDGTSGTTTPGSATAEPSAEQGSTPVSADENPNTVPQTVHHAQPGMQNMPAPPAARPETQTGKTLALTGPPRVPVGTTNQPAPAGRLVVTQAGQVPEKGRIVIGPISFQGPPRHKAYAITAQQKLWTGIMGGLVLVCVGLLVTVRKLPSWYGKFRSAIQRKGGKNQAGPKLALEGAPQRASPLAED
jgi:hypothetical protein